MRVVPYFNADIVNYTGNPCIDVENYCRYHAAHEVFGQVTFNRSWDGKDVILSPLNTRAVLLSNAADPLFPDMTQFREASNSVGWLPSSLLNRDVFHLNLDETIREIPDYVESGFFIKLNTYSKFNSVVKPFELLDDKKYNEYASDLVTRLIDYDDSPVILLQKYCDVQFEYRFLVFEGELITGSGCIDWLNPTFNYHKDKFFKQVIRYRKNAYNPDASIRELTETELEDYIRFAKEAVRQIKLVSGLTEYSMDVAVIDNKISLLEINPLNNSGLFGCDVELLYKAIKNKFEKDYR